MTTRILLMLAALVTLPACSFFSHSHEPTIEQAASYTGPAVEFDSTTRTHIAKITCPTAGWSATHDLTREGWPSHEVFITLIAPPQGDMTAQVLTTLLVDTQVRSGAPCRVYIRRAPESPDSVADGSYTLAATAQPATTR